MIDMKICSQCYECKLIDGEYYLWQGRPRSECKRCTIKRNVRYQKRVKAWRHRYVDEEARRLYMREYYNQNKEKFAKYRSEFKARNPEYYKEYFRKRKETF